MLISFLVDAFFLDSICLLLKQAEQKALPEEIYAIHRDGTFPKPEHSHSSLLYGSPIAPTSRIVRAISEPGSMTYRTPLRFWMHSLSHNSPDTSGLDMLIFCRIKLSMELRILWE